MSTAITRPLSMLRVTAAVAGVALMVSVVAAADPAAALEGQPTVVSLTFDDSNADQMAAVDIMNANALDGTFYTLSGFIGAPGYQTRADLDAIAAAGHEIASHTVTHPDMATLNSAEAIRQACESRATLTSWGFPITSFAYPFASMNATAKSAVQGCGYNSARNLGDIETRFGCAGCGFAETVPPVDPFELRVPDQVDSTWTLADLQNTVMNAENTTGGWVGFTFHHVCANCDVEGLNITPALFQSFAEWLAARPTTHNTSVRTVNQVVGGAVKPLVSTTLPPAPGPGVNGVVNPSLEQLGTNGVPDCWITAGFGANAPTFSTVAPGRTGSVAERLVMSNYVDGDAKLIFTMDFGTCAPTVTPGHRYSLRAWYTSTTVTQFAVYLRNSIGAWEYWTSSPYFAAASSYSQAIWDSDPIPAGYTGISFGLNLFGNGTLVTDDYALYDLVGAPGAIVPATPTITGTPRVGATLTAAPGSWTPAGVGFAYRWLRDGVIIPGADGSSHVLTTADRGHRLRVVVTGTLAGFAPASATSAATAPIQRRAVNVSRIAGADRFATAVAISQHYAPGVARVYVATGSVFADALGAAPAAARFDSPLLLTASSSLPTSVRNEILRLAPARIIVVGGVGAVGASVYSQLSAIAPTSRIAGADRYATSRAITAEAFAGGATTAFVATGANFPDALSAAPAASAFNAPTILVPGSAGSVDAATRSLLDTLGTSTVKIAGGTGAVSASFAAAVNQVPGVTSVQRLAGNDRYATAAAINQNAFTAADTSYLAVGTGFADALVGAALAGRQGGPLFLTPTACLSPHADAGIERVQSSDVTLFGGVGVLSANVANLVVCT